MATMKNNLPFKKIEIINEEIEDLESKLDRESKATVILDSK